MFCCSAGAGPANEFRGGAISVIFGSQVSLRIHFCKRDGVYLTTLLWQNSLRQNGLISRMLFSELHKIIVKKVTFVGFRGAIAPIASPWIRPCCSVTLLSSLGSEEIYLDKVLVFAIWFSSALYVSSSNTSHRGYFKTDYPIINWSNLWQVS